MLLAFGFLAPAGTFVARYLKGIGILSSPPLSSPYPHAHLTCRSPMVPAAHQHPVHPPGADGVSLHHHRERSGRKKRRSLPEPPQHHRPHHRHPHFRPGLSLPPLLSPLSPCLLMFYFCLFVGFVWYTCKCILQARARGGSLLP